MDISRTLNAWMTFATAAIKAWNRLSIASRTAPGTYQPPKIHELKKGALQFPGKQAKLHLLTGDVQRIEPDFWKF
jgi:hypothetical protein